MTLPNAAGRAEAAPNGRRTKGTKPGCRRDPVHAQLKCILSLRSRFHATSAPCEITAGRDRRPGCRQDRAGVTRSVGQSHPRGVHASNPACCMASAKSSLPAALPRILLRSGGPCCNPVGQAIEADGLQDRTELDPELGEWARVPPEPWPLPAR